MSFTIRYTRQAQDDIIRNADWWAEKHSVPQAREWKQTIIEQIRTLQEMPERCALAPETLKCKFSLRQLLVGKGPRPTYRAVYAVQETPDGPQVVIITVRSAAEDEIRSEDLTLE
jgi:plasmid stabilization system protein ParE